MELIASSCRSHCSRKRGASLLPPLGSVPDWLKPQRDRPFKALQYCCCTMYCCKSRKLYESFQRLLNLLPALCDPQGFQWYAHELQRDSDGDVACAFLEESPELGGYSGRDHQSTAAGALPAGSTARKGAGAQLQSKSSGQAQQKPGSGLQARPPLAEVPPERLQPVGMCPILCCIDGNLTLSLGPSQEVGFA